VRLARRVVGRKKEAMKPYTIPRAVRLPFLDELAKHIGHVVRRNARENTSHRYGHGPMLVWSATSGTGTLLVQPYSSGSGVVRVHVNRYSAESRLLGWTAEISCMPDELLVLVPWLVEMIRCCSMEKPVPEHELFAGSAFAKPVARTHVYLWTKRADAHEAMNARGASLVKETSA